jgi:hypothetical protein
MFAQTVCRPAFFPPGLLLDDTSYLTWIEKPGSSNRRTERLTDLSMRHICQSGLAALYRLPSIM